MVDYGDVGLEVDRWLGLDMRYEPRKGLCVLSPQIFMEIVFWRRLWRLFRGIIEDLGTKDMLMY